MNYIIFASLLQALFAIAMVVSAKEKQKADYLLLCLLSCIGIHLATKFYIFNVVTNEAVTFRMHTCIQLAYGPLLYLYARKKNDADFIPAKLWYLFVPLIITVTLYTCTSLALRQYPEIGSSILSFYNATVFIPIVASHIIFGFITPSFKTKDNSISIFKWLLIALGATEIVLFLSGNTSPHYNEYVRSTIYLILGSIPVIVIWQRQQGYLPVKIGGEKKSESTEERKPALETSKQQEIFLTLEKLLTEKQLYRDEDLSLEKLSTASGINRHHISETLNAYAKKPFYQYINEYRIQEVIRQLDNPSKKVRLLTVAYDCGFKTKASFNQYFKKITGMTPSGYLKEKAA